MSTFKELQQKLMAAKFKSVVYQHLVDHLEGEFRASAGNPPKKVLLTDDKLPIPDATIEEVVKELFGGLENVSKEAERILTISIPQPEPAPAPVSAPVAAPVPAPAPVVAPEAGRKKSKNSQGEVPS